MYIAGPTPVALRQLSAAAFAGMRPQNASAIVFAPFAVDRYLVYVNPDDHAESALTQGGLFDFGPDQTVRILEVRALAGLGNISAVVTDRIDVQTMSLTVGGATPAINLLTLGVAPGDKVEITIGALTEVYPVKRVVSATVLETDAVGSTYALVAPDIFTITSGKTVLFTHTLGGVDTLDIDPVTTHDVAIGTPATSRLVMSDIVVVLPTQVLKITTAGSNAAGWLDVYVVKAGIYG